MRASQRRPLSPNHPIQAVCNRTLRNQINTQVTLASKEHWELAKTLSTDATPTGTHKSAASWGVQKNDEATGTGQRCQENAALALSQPRERGHHLGLATAAGLRARRTVPSQPPVLLASEERRSVRTKRSRAQRARKLARMFRWIARSAMGALPSRPSPPPLSTSRALEATIHQLVHSLPFCSDQDETRLIDSLLGHSARSDLGKTPEGHFHPRWFLWDQGLVRGGSWS